MLLGMLIQEQRQKAAHQAVEVEQKESDEN
jgi:hypothetical protein